MSETRIVDGRRYKVTYLASADVEEIRARCATPEWVGRRPMVNARSYGELTDTMPSGRIAPKHSYNVSG